MRKIIFIITSVLLFSSCEKDDLEVDKTVSNMAGYWVYISDEYLPPLNDSLPSNLQDVDCYSNSTYYVIVPDSRYKGEADCILVIEEGNCISDRGGKNGRCREYSYRPTISTVDSETKIIEVKEVTYLTEDRMTLELIELYMPALDEFGNFVMHEESEGVFSQVYIEPTGLEYKRTERLKRLR